MVIRLRNIQTVLWTPIKRLLWLLNHSLGPIIGAVLSLLRFIILLPLDYLYLPSVFFIRCIKNGGGFFLSLLVSLLAFIGNTLLVTITLPYALLKNLFKE